VARALIVGCGCRGRELGRHLRARDWQVRGTSRQQAGLEGIDSAGLEAALADPDRPGTILDLCGDVSVVVWLLGSAVGEPGQIAAIHGPRLERLLEKLVESPVRGFAYESTGSASLEQLWAGREIVEGAAETWRIPVAILDWSRDEPGWAERAGEAVAGLLAG
jgi:nucleoside-diphosphate-sugar epimerase